MTTPGKGEADRLLAEARRDRDRVRRLAGRFVRRWNSKQMEARNQIAAERAKVDAERQRLVAEAERFKATYLEFQTGSVVAQQRFRDSWADLQRQQRRALEERADSEAYFRGQEKAFAAREADLARRIQRSTSEKTKLDDAIALRRKELEALDARVLHAHEALREAEAKRNALLAESIPEAVAVSEAPLEPPVPLNRKADRDLLAWGAELDKREQQLRKGQAALVPMKAAIERAAGDVLDERRLLAEQFAMLAAAQERWTEAERYTVLELEDLAYVLRRRERELDDRERNLIAADRRRRDENHALWQTRLKLDGWRGVLTAHEAWWQTERGRQEADLAARRLHLDECESAMSRTTAAWSERFQNERNRLQNEIEQWTVARSRLDLAISACDRQRNESLNVLKSYAAKSLALDETFRETLGGSETSRPARRFKVLKKRWETAFSQRQREIEKRILAAAEERQKLDSRYRELQKSQAGAAERNAATLHRIAELEREGARIDSIPFALAISPANHEEMATLRSEVERLAFALMNAEWPKAPEPAVDFDREDDVLPMPRRERAA